jgi:hypothetical protein
VNKKRDWSTIRQEEVLKEIELDERQMKDDERKNKDERTMKNNE